MCELHSTLRDLKQKQSHFSKTFNSWQFEESKSAIANKESKKEPKKASKRGSKQQASLFD
jgi:uncharacterized protein YdcH (DUF465 family)